MCRVLYERRLLHKAYLRKNQETLQISVFPPIVTNVLYFPFEPRPLMCTSKKKLGRITNINIWSHGLKFSEKNYFMLSFYCTALCGECSKETYETSFIEHTYKIRIYITRGGSRTAATSKIERFVIIVNGWKPLTTITKCSILDVAAVLDPPLITIINIPYYVRKFSKEKCFMRPFLLCLYYTALCAGYGSNEFLNHLHRTRPREY